MVPKALITIAFALFVFVACGGRGEVVPVVEPSAAICPTSGTRGCKASEDCGGGLHCTGGSCYANQAGCPCSNIGDCGGSAHCTQGTCYANQPGVPCTQPTDCGPRAHCTVGTCYANQSGSPCSEQSDCGAGSSCVSGTCN